MAAVPQTLLTSQEYLAREREGSLRHEFHRGEAFAMSGGSRAHSLVAGNTLAVLHAQFVDGPCEVHGSDMRVKVQAAGLYTYPDVSVVCGDANFEDAVQDTLLNPAVLCEVLSPSTEAYDRGEKFALYRRLDSLKHYVLISQREPRIECYDRDAENRWVLREAIGLDQSLPLSAVHAALELASVFARVSFDR